jgi:hypothetical protein
LMQKWRLLLKEEDKKLFDQAKKLSWSGWKTSSQMF